MNRYMGMLILVTSLFGQELRESDQHFKIVGTYAASHILITYDGAKLAPYSMTRTKKEARVMAENIAAELRTNPERFEDLADQHSDGPSAKTSGYIGGFGPRDMVGAFTRAVKRLEIGEITSEPVKTEYGFHIIRKESLKPKHFSGQLFLVSYKGAEILKDMPRERVGSRTKEEAKSLIDSYRARVTGDSFDSLHMEHSDFKKNEGFLGVFSLGKGRMYREIRKHLEKTPLGEVTPVFELPIGFVFVKRLPVVKFAGRRILICYAGCEHCPPHIGRSRSDARTEAEELLAQLHAGALSFEEAAELYSNEAYATRKGKVPDWFPGTIDPRLEREFKRLQVGEIGKVLIETDRGFFLIKREVYQQ